MCFGEGRNKIRTSAIREIQPREHREAQGSQGRCALVLALVRF